MFLKLLIYLVNEDKKQTWQTTLYFNKHLYGIESTQSVLANFN